MNLAECAHVPTSVSTDLRSASNGELWQANEILRKGALISQKRSSTAESYPHVLAALRELLETDQDARFVFAVDLVLHNWIGGKDSTPSFAATGRLV